MKSYTQNATRGEVLLMLALVNAIVLRQGMLSSNFSPFLYITIPLFIFLLVIFRKAA